MTLRRPMSHRPRLRTRAVLALACLFTVAGSPVRAAADPPAPREAATSPAREPQPVAVAAPWEKLGLPRYTPPAAYSEDLVITTEHQSVTMKRAIDHARTRTEFTAQGQHVVMIELGDDKGTMLTLMPEQKQAMRQSRASLQSLAGMAGAKAEDTPAAASDAPPDVKHTARETPPGVTAEDLGEATLGGTAARKFRLTSEDGVVLAWFDKATGAPLRMESTVEGKPAVMEWKHRSLVAPPPSMFEVPKGYQVQDMDELMAKMNAMGGTSGMAQGMLSSMGQGMGANLGASFGAGLGASLGGPLGAMAGHYLGGRIGGMLGGKAASLAP